MLKLDSLSKEMCFDISETSIRGMPALRGKREMTCFLEYRELKWQCQMLDIFQTFDEVGDLTMFSGCRLSPMESPKELADQWSSANVHIGGIESVKTNLAQALRGMLGYRAFDP